MAKKKIPQPIIKSEEDYQTEDDIRTIERMGEIMADPKRHERAKKKAKEKMQHMAKTHKMMGLATDSGEDESMGGMIKKTQRERTL